MTGFGAARAQVQGWKITVECRSVNHRGLDVRAHLPRAWAPLESDVVGIVQAQLGRGRVEIRLDTEYDRESASARLIDPQKFSAIASELRELAEANDLERGVRVADVLTFDDVFKSPEIGEIEDHDAILTVVREAVDELVDSRTAEGRKLLVTMHDFVDQIEDDLQSINGRIEPELAAYRGRLIDRMKEALEKFEIDEIDEDRIVQEVAYYADKSDVSEELQRAFSHVGKLREVLNRDDDEPCGKNIDFYLQEMMREANTTGSKTGSAEITDAVIRIKSTVEKMREQAANIE